MGRYRDSGLVQYTFCHVLRLNSDRSSKGATSGMGQSRHFDRRPTTSGPPLETDIVRAGRHVSKVPTAEMSGLFDHLISEQCGDAEFGMASKSGANAAGS
jgi:hypothetical protein